MKKSPRLFGLAVAAFAIGTESYVIAGLLPSLSADLGVSPAMGGQLITAFSLAYAFGSPFLAIATGTMERKRLLLGSLAVFGLFNLIAAASHSYAALMAARIGMALSAGTFMPAASAYAVAVVPAARRGRALAIIYTGLTVATVIGVPLGVLVGEHFGWRTTFSGVAALTAAAFVGLLVTLQRVPSSAAASLSERIAIARRPDVLGALVVTVITLAGAFSLYAYIALFLKEAADLDGSAVAAVLFLFGAGSAVGNLVSGSASDRFSPRRIIKAVLVSLIVLFSIVALSAGLLAPHAARWVIVPSLVLWGFIGWSFPAAQQARLVAMEPKLAPITLSLNASAIYLGVSVGAALGSIMVAHHSVARLGWLAAACELLAFAVLAFSPKTRRARAGDKGEPAAHPEAERVENPEPAA